MEELKGYRSVTQKNLQEQYILGCEDGYNKAIDDLIMYAKLHRKYADNTKDDYINFDDFIKFAEQLKAGGRE